MPPVPDSSMNQFDSAPPAALITSVSSKVPMVQAVRTAIEKHNTDGKVFGADTNADCIASHFVDGFWVAPCDEQLLIDDVVEWCKPRQVSVIFPSRDGELPFWARHREQLKERGLSVMVSDDQTVETCLDKLAFYQHCERYGFPAIYTSEQSDHIKNDSLVVKERYGAGSRNAGINVDHAQAQERAHSIISPVYQPCIFGEEISADLYITAAGVVKGVVLRYRNLVISGESQVTTSFRDETLEILCMVMAGSLGLRGHVMFQIIVDHNNKPHIVECNCRFGGASTLSIECGLDSFYWFLLESAGSDLDSIKVELAHEPLQQVRYAADKVLPA